MRPNDHATTGAILAGWRSIRMGSNKALLPFQGAPLIAGLLRKIRSLLPETLMIANDPRAYRDPGVSVWPDRIPDQGPLGGLSATVSLDSFPQTFCTLNTGKDLEAAARLAGGDG